MFRESSSETNLDKPITQYPFFKGKKIEFNQIKLDFYVKKKKESTFRE